MDQPPPKPRRSLTTHRPVFFIDLLFRPSNRLSVIDFSVIVRGRGFIIRGAGIVLSIAVFVIQLRARDKGIGHVITQSNQVWAHPPRESQIKMQPVIDRVKLAIAQEIQVTPTGIKGG